MAVALVPLKDLVTAKTRLAGILRPSERRALALAMVEDVLAVLAPHPDISRVVLLSNDPGAHLLAEKYAAEYWPESGFEGTGLNALLTAAAGRLLDQGCDALVILHGDLPLLQTEDITAVVRQHREVRGLSQEKLAELADLHRNHVGLIERAERSPSIENAQRIAAALGMTLSGLVAEVERELAGGAGAPRKRKAR